MGIQGLLGVLKSIHKPSQLEEFRGKTLAVDAYGWLHRGAVACAAELATNKPTTKLRDRPRHVDFCMNRVRMLRHFGVAPYLVFDGDRLPSKDGTEELRHKKRAESRANALKLLSEGKKIEANQEFQKCVDITPSMAHQLIEQLKAWKVAYIVAPYEADAQLVYLEKKGLVDGIISEDSDLLVFGARVLLTKLDQHGHCVRIRRDDFTGCRAMSLVGMTDADFRCMAILSGCDYLANLPSIGLKTAHRLVRKHKTIDRIVRALQLENKIRIPADYLDQFRKADKTFMYQYVYCPQLKKLVHLQSPTNTEELTGADYIGKHYPSDVAARVADGELDPLTKEPLTFSAQYWRRQPTPVRQTTMTPKGQAIDTFFRRSRVPLLELDPNSLTPISDSTYSAPSSVRSTFSTQASMTSVSSLTSRRSSITSIELSQASVYTPAKRVRLCSESPSSDLSRTTSKFFSIGTAQSPAKGMSKLRKSQKFEIYSDSALTKVLAHESDRSHAHPQLRKRKSSEIEAMANDAFTESLVAPIWPMHSADAAHEASHTGSELECASASDSPSNDQLCRTAVDQCKTRQSNELQQQIECAASSPSAFTASTPFADINTVSGSEDLLVTDSEDEEIESSKTFDLQSFTFAG